MREGNEEIKESSNWFGTRMLEPSINGYEKPKQNSFLFLFRMESTLDGPCCGHDSSPATTFQVHQALLERVEKMSCWGTRLPSMTRGPMRNTYGEL